MAAAKTLAQLQAEIAAKATATHAAHAAGQISQPQLASALQSLLKSYQKQKVAIAIATQLQSQANAANSGLAGAFKNLTSKLTGHTRAVGGSAYFTPRQALAVAKGNISNTGRNVGLGLAAGAIGLGAAASPIGIETIAGPLKILAAVIGAYLLPTIVKLGTEALNTAQSLRRGREQVPDPQHPGKMKDRVPTDWVNRIVGTTITGALGTLGFMVGGSKGAMAGIAMGGALQENRRRRWAREHGAGVTDEDDRSNRMKIIQTMQLALGGQASVGKAQDAWGRIQSGMVMTPFEKEMLQIMRENLTALQQENQAVQRMAGRAGGN